MKKLIAMAFVLSVVFGGTAAYAAVDCTRENWVDQAGDWFATRGKNGIEKDKVLAARKADRITKCTKREAEKASKEVKKKLGF